MKHPVLPLLLSIVLTSLATPGYAGVCEPNADAHAKFCEGKTRDVCKVHTAVCTWKDADKTIEVIVRNADAKCEAQDGQEAHETFCSNLKKPACRTHDTTCVWK